MEMVVGVVTDPKVYNGQIYISEPSTQWQIPIPEGVDIKNCVFSIDDTQYGYAVSGHNYGDADQSDYRLNWSYATVTTDNIDQDTGIIHFPKQTLGTGRIKVEVIYMDYDGRFYINYHINVYG